MENSVFVARERELERLDGLLQRALVAQGLVCFVTGEAGSGKTTLVTEFARRAQEKHKALVIAVGQSDAQTGEGDAYLPFREVLGQLTGDVETKLAQGAITQENASRLRQILAFSGRALVEVGPDLIDLFVPWVGLATRAAAFAADKIGWLDRMEQLVTKPRAGSKIGHTGIQQDHIFEQYTNVLNRLSEQQPLLLVLDDLQWADVASIGLLFRLGRRIGGSRILIVGTYRPEEVAIGRLSTISGRTERHPLEKVLAEFKRYFGDICVELDQAQEVEGRHFVDAILDTEPNRLGEGFRQALYHHTGGHPLFTIELLRAMQERGDLVHHQSGCWVEGPALDWATFPARVEGVIEERIGRLQKDLREALTVGSVEGERFTAEVVARVQTANARQLIRQLSGELEKQHRLVSARGIQHLAGQRLSEYQFQHNLFQSYLYNELAEAERAYLHEDVGLVLEALYGDQADEIAVQLARHFVEAGIQDKAVGYLQIAGQQAAARYAHQEAERYLSQALAMLPEVDTFTDCLREELEQRYALHLAREEVYATLGHREVQRQELATLCRLAEVLDDDARRTRVSLRQARYAEMTGDYAAVREALAAASQAAHAAQDIGLEAQVTRANGFLLWRMGDFKEAHVQLDRALELARDAGLREVEASTLHSLAVVHWRLGEPDEARAYARQAMELSREIGDRLTQGMAINVLGNVELTQGNFESARDYYEENLRNSQEIGNRRGEAMDLGNLGIIAEIQGDFAGAMARFEQVRQAFHDIGDRASEARAWAHLGMNAAVQGAYDPGRAYYEQALEIYREIGNRQGEGWVLQILASLLAKVGDHEQAASLAREALELDQELGARSAEAAAWTTLAAALVSGGDLESATEAYQRGLEIRRELGEQNLVIESVAGLVRVALIQGDRARALTLVEEVLAYLDENPIEGTDEPLDIYLTCYQVLQANLDSRTLRVLHKAHTLLLEKAAMISDESLRRSFLENVPAHGAILREFAASQQDK